MKQETPEIPAFAGMTCWGRREAVVVIGGQSGGWRAAGKGDVPKIARLSQTLLGDLGEDEAVFGERVRLCPEGCFVLENGGAVHGYMVSHPWRRGRPPALHRPIGAIPADADCWYIHDVAIETHQRGNSAARGIIEHVAQIAEKARFSTLALVAVSGASTYWLGLGFEEAMDDGLRAVLKAYGDDALYMERAIGELPAGRR